MITNTDRTTLKLYSYTIWGNKLHSSQQQGLRWFYRKLSLQTGMPLSAALLFARRQLLEVDVVASSRPPALSPAAGVSATVHKREMEGGIPLCAPQSPLCAAHIRLLHVTNPVNNYSRVHVGLVPWRKKAGWWDELQPSSVQPQLFSRLQLVVTIFFLLRVIPLTFI